MEYFGELPKKLRTFPLIDVNSDELAKLLLDAAEAIEALLIDKEVLEDMFMQLSERDE